MHAGEHLSIAVGPIRVRLILSWQAQDGPVSFQQLTRPVGIGLLEEVPVADAVTALTAPRDVGLRSNS